MNESSGPGGVHSRGTSLASRGGGRHSRLRRQITRSRLVFVYFCLQSAARRSVCRDIFSEVAGGWFWIEMTVSGSSSVSAHASMFFNYHMALWTPFKTDSSNAVKPAATYSRRLTVNHSGRNAFGSSCRSSPPIDTTRYLQCTLSDLDGFDLCASLALAPKIRNLHTLKCREIKEKTRAFRSWTR